MNYSKKLQSTLALGIVSLAPSAAQATEFESLKSALENALGIKGQKNKTLATIYKKTYTLGKLKHDLYYTKDAKGNAVRFATVQKDLYKPDCTHTWVIGMKVKPAVEVEQVRVVEMKCKHAFPAKERSFLSQFEGKKIADAKTLDRDVGTVATATYTATYTTQAVIRALKLASQFRP